MKTNTLVGFKKFAFTLILVLLGLVSAIAQTVRSEALEDETSSIKDQAYQGLQKETGISNAEVWEFFRYYQDTLSACMVKLTNDLQNTEFNSKIEEEYVSSIQSRFIKLYNNFKQIKNEFPSSVAEALAPQKWHNPTGVCNPACDNIDFSNGDLSAWTCGYASCAAENGAPCSNGPPPTGSFIISAPVYQTPGAGITSSAGPDAATGNDHQVILEKGGTDAVTGIPKVCPGYTYSAMVGDSNGGPGKPSQGVAMLEQTFQVTPANAEFYYNYAVVLNNPTHCYYQQPYFSVVMLDQSGDTIPHCGNYNVVAGGSNISSSSTWQYINKNSGNEIDYLNWTTAFVSLKAYVGQCITVQVITADCGKGGHYGYAYFVAKCQQLGIITSAPALCGNPITLTAPTGGVSYQWIAPGPGCMTPAAGNTQSISINCPGKYSVIIQTVAGALCADTLDTIVPGATGSAPVPFFKADTVCAGAATHFTNATTGGSAANTYIWTFQGGTTSSAANPTFTFPAAGTYTTSLQALNGTCGGDTTLNVVVTGISTAGFKATTVCQNNPTVFTDTSKNANNWSWNFGEPSSGAKNTSTLQNPTHTYATAGTFTVTEVTGTLPCTDTAKGTIIVNPLPAAAFKFTSACFGQTTTFTDATTIASGTDTAWNWNFGDPGSGANNTSTLQNPTHTFSAPGTYSVILTVTSNSDCQSTVTIPVIVSAVPVAAFNTLPVCQGKPTLFNNTSTGTFGTYSWTFGDGGTSTAQNPTHIYAISGGFVASLTVTTTSGCTDSTKDSVFIYPVPVAKFTATTVCKGDSTKFTDASSIGVGGTIATWSWNFGDGGTSILQTPTHLYGAAGTYNVSLIVVSKNGCDSTYNLNVIVNPIPKPAFTANAPCLGNPTLFTDSSSIASGSITGWSWNFGDGNTSTTQNPSNTYSTAGTDTVDFVVTSNSGCVDSIKQPVTVNPNPVVSFSAPDTAGCVTLCVHFKNTSNISSGTIASWSWNFGDGNTSALDTPMHCYSTVDTFTVSLTATSNFGCTTTYTKPNYIVTYPIPVANFTDGPNPTEILYPTVNFFDKSGGNPVSWYWTFGDATDSSAISQNTIHTYQDTGTFITTLIIANQYGCIDSVKHPVTIEPYWTFYVPNAFTPNSDGLNDYFIPKAYGVISFEMWIFDRWGQLLYHCTSLSQPWDGTVHTGPNSGQKCQEDTYVWLVEFTDVYKNSHHQVGRVTLIR